MNSEQREDIETSEQHKAKDFQLIHVPKGAVSKHKSNTLRLHTQSMQNWLKYIWAMIVYRARPFLVLVLRAGVQAPGRV